MNRDHTASPLRLHSGRADSESLTVDDAAHQRSVPTTLGRTAKRALDIGLSLPIVLFVLPPVAILVKMSHWLQSPGPLFFRQKRCGQNRTSFMILKFRTMDAPPRGASEISDDSSSRIFPWGRILRNTKLDEIPQFVNVLAGTMSVVGPRPHHFEDCEQFENRVQDYSHRTAVKPGITGLAQYTEYRGDFEWNCLKSRVEKDLFYIRNWSLALDLQLITGTLLAISQHSSKHLFSTLLLWSQVFRKSPDAQPDSLIQGAPSVALTDQSATVQPGHEEERKAA